LRITPGNDLIAVAKSPSHQQRQGFPARFVPLRSGHALHGRRADSADYRPVVLGDHRCMKRNPRHEGKRSRAKSILRLPDLEAVKTAVLNSLSSADAQRGYRHAIDEFVEWYCSEPRLSFGKTVVLRYRMHLESRTLAPGTINLRLGAVRRLAYEAADCGLLSADLAAGVRRVKGVKETGRQTRQLVDRRTGASTLAGARPRESQGQTRSGTSRATAGLRTSPARARQADFQSSAAAGRTLGDRRSTGKGWSCSDHSCSGLGAWVIR